MCEVNPNWPDKILLILINLYTFHYYLSDFSQNYSGKLLQTRVLYSSQEIYNLSEKFS